MTSNGQPERHARPSGVAGEIPETRWARTRDGIDIAYQDLGAGPVSLVVIHGWVSHLEVYWESPRYARFMRRLASSMRVLVFDKRGFGMSDRLAGDVNLETRADDIDAVMRAAGVQRAVVLAWGGSAPELAVFFAASAPDRVQALIVDGWVQRRTTADWPWGSTEAEAEQDLALVLRDWGKNLASGFSGDYDPTSEQQRWEGKFTRFAATPSSVEAFDRISLATEVVSFLPMIRVPTLVITSHGSPHEEMARHVARLIPASQLVVTPGTEAVVWYDEPEPYVRAVESFLGLQAPAGEIDRVLATLLFTDIVESTEQAAAMGDQAWNAFLADHHVLTLREIDRHRGNFVDSAGDGHFAYFDGPARAVRCAHAIVRAAAEHGLRIRAGCHTGEVQLHGVAVRGIAVHTGARIASMAEPSQVLVSSTVKDLTAGSGLAYEDWGEHELKGVPDRWRVYRSLEAPAP